MARPSIKTQRTEEILQAYESCIARYGVEGATLQKVAEEAGLARPLLRHHVGNRDDLLDQAIKRFIARSEKQTTMLIDNLPKKNRAAVLIDHLFEDYDSALASRDVMIACALIAEAQNRAPLKKTLAKWFTSFQNKITKEFAGCYPSSSPEQVNAVASGIIGIYFNVESLMHLGSLNDLRNRSKQAALQLLSTLNTKGKK